MALWLVLFSPSLACQEDPQLERRVVRYFSTYRAQDPTGIEVVGHPVPQWVHIDEEATPALVGNAGFSVWLKSDRIEGGSFSGHYILLRDLEHAQPDVDATVVFRLIVADRSLEKRQTIFEESLSQTLPRPRRADVRLPDEWRGGYVGVEVEYLGTSDGVSAAWIDPRLFVPVAIDQPQLPNVLLVTADTTRPDDLAPYGGSAATPTLQLLASEGMRFDNAFTVATGTTPSHSSLFTASHPVTHGVYDNETILSADFTTLAEVLSEIGYETAAFVSAVPVSSALGLSQGFHLFDEFFGVDRASGLGGYSYVERRADRTTSRFLGWLEERARGPFFAWVHYYDPHQPYAPPTQYEPDAPSEAIAKLFEKDSGEPRYVGGDHPKGISLPAVLSRGLPLDAVAEYARSRYRGEIAHMDAEFGKIVQRLREQGLYDETLIVFTADHGENFLEHGIELGLTHAGLFGSVVHVPLIIKFPGGRYAGASTKQLVASIDIAPTILAELGKNAPQAWEGNSVLDFSGQERPEQGRRTVVIESAHRQEISIRSGEWMYREIRAEFRQLPEVRDYLGFGEALHELYDLTRNPDEDRNVYPDARASPLLRRLEAFGTLAPNDGSKLGSEEHSKALRALGYVH